MTSLQGYVEATYDELLEAFGEPAHYDDSDNKVTTEFTIFTEDGPIFLYDWKEYDRGEKCRSGLPYDWHVGGRNRLDTLTVERMLEDQGRNQAEEL